jgi:hypothetical protein
VVLVRRVTLAWSVVLLSLTLSISLAPAAHAAFPGGNGDIAFSRSIHGQSDIWIVRAGVTGTVNRTNTPHRLESQPDYNTTGTRIAYTRCTEGVRELRPVGHGRRRRQQDSAHVYPRRAGDMADLVA